MVPLVLTHLPQNGIPLEKPQMGSQNGFDHHGHVPLTEARWAPCCRGSRGSVPPTSSWMRQYAVRGAFARSNVWHPKKGSFVLMACLNWLDVPSYPLEAQMPSIRNPLNSPQSTLPVWPTTDSGCIAVLQCDFFRARLRVPLAGSILDNSMYKLWLPWTWQFQTPESVSDTPPMDQALFPWSACEAHTRDIHTDLLLTVLLECLRSDRRFDVGMPGCVGRNCLCGTTIMNTCSMLLLKSIGKIA